jgi:hypothetical protein
MVGLREYHSVAATVPLVAGASRLAAGPRGGAQDVPVDHRHNAPQQSADTLHGMAHLRRPSKAVSQPMINSHRRMGIVGWQLRF